MSPYDSGHVDGTLDWIYETDSWLWSSPAIGSEGVLYFGSPDNNLYALDAVEGTLLWSYATDGDILSSPAVSCDETIYFGSGDHNIYALNPDGSLKWRYTTEGEVYSSPTVDEEGNVYVGSYDGNLYSVNSEGELRWVFSSDSWLWSSPAVGSNSAVYVGSGDHNLYAMDMKTGEELWRFETGGQIYSSPAVCDHGFIYFGSYDGYLYALDPDGGMEWSYHVGSRIHPSPAIGNDGTIYIGSHDGTFHAIRDGEELWAFSTGGRISSSAALSRDGRLYFGSYDNTFYALDVNGDLRWSHDMGHTVYSSPAIDEKGRVMVGDWNGNVYAFTGREWEPGNEVMFSLSVAGRKGNTVQGVIQENGVVVSEVLVERTPGPPNRVDSSFDFHGEMDYTLTLRYNGKYPGANPVNITFNTGIGYARIFHNFVRAHGAKQEVTFDLNDILGDMVSKSREIDPAMGNTARLDTTLSVFFYCTVIESAEVRFYDSRDDSLIGSLRDVPRGDVAFMDWNDLNPGKEYGWYAVATHEEFPLTFGPWTFTTPGIDSVRITKGMGGSSSLTGGFVHTDREEMGYLSAFNTTHGFIGVLNAYWEVHGGDSELIHGQYQRFNGIHVGSVEGEVTLIATFGKYSSSVLFSVITPISERISGIPQDVNIRRGEGSLDMGLYISGLDDRSLKVSVDDPNVDVRGNVLHFYHSEPGTHQVRVDLEDELTSTFVIIAVHVESDLAPTVGLTGFPWILILIPLGILGAILYAAKFKFTVEDIFLIHDSGVLIKHTSSTLNNYSKEDILAGMFVAVNNYVHDAFGGDEKNTLKSMEYGNKKVLIQKGENVVLAVFVSGWVPSRLDESMARLVADIEERYGGEIEGWNGNLSQLPGITEMLETMHRENGRYPSSLWGGMRSGEIAA